MAATASSRFVVPNYWPDPKTGIGYQVQVEIPQPSLRSIADLEKVPVLHRDENTVLFRDIASLSQTTMPGQFDRYNLKRELTLTANVFDSDLGSVASLVNESLKRVKTLDDATKDRLEKEGQKPGRVTYELANVELIAAEKNGALSVPRGAVLQRDGQTMCLAVGSDGVIIRKSVSVGLRSVSDLEITSGLDGSEELIVANAIAFKEGQLVQKAK